MAESIEGVSPAQTKPLPQELLEGAMGHGISVRAGRILRHVVVTPDSPWLEGEPVGRYDEDIFVVSDAVPVRPLPHAPHLLTQDQLLLNFAETGDKKPNREVDVTSIFEQAPLEVVPRSELESGWQQAA